MNTHGKKWLGNAILLLASLIWGSAFVAQRVGMDTIDPLTFNAARMVPAAVTIGIVALIMWAGERRRPSKKTPEERKRCNRATLIGGISCGTFLAIASILQQMGLVYTTAGKAGFITAMYMLLVPIIGFVLFRRRNTWLVWLAVLIGIVGMYFLCITDEFQLTQGDILMLLCAVVFSCHILCCDHFAKIGDPVRMSAIQFVTAAVISIIIAFIAAKPSAESIRAAIVPILYCGIASGGIGYTLQIVGQRYTEPAVASLLLSMEAVFAVIFGALLLNEHMSARELAGCGIMLVAIILVQVPLPKRRKSAGKE